ncbi:MAG TPA: UrcA family protein [Steroidobacteraceae bacterium]|nr:UrcA family protein [Steroidobacteraceae bacterium]
MKSIKLLAVVAALSFSSLASATVTADSSSVVVRYGDLNLASGSGVKNLHARLRSASESVCKVLDSRVLGLHDQYQQCVNDALSRSVARVANPNLTNYHRYRALPRTLAAN